MLWTPRAEERCGLEWCLPPALPTTRPWTTAFPGPFKTDNFSYRYRFKPFLVPLNEIHSFKNKKKLKKKKLIEKLELKRTTSIPCIFLKRKISPIFCQNYLLLSVGIDEGELRMGETVVYCPLCPHINSKLEFKMTRICLRRFENTLAWIVFIMLLFSCAFIRKLGFFELCIYFCAFLLDFLQKGSHHSVLSAPICDNFSKYLFQWTITANRLCIR